MFELVARSERKHEVAQPRALRVNSSKARREGGRFSISASESCATEIALPSKVGHFVQAKLQVGAPNDALEQEADRVAELVTRTPLAVNDSAGADSIIKSLASPAELQRACASCNEDETVQAKASSAHGVADHSLQDLARLRLGSEPQSPSFADVLDRARSAGGDALPNPVRQYMEPRFRHDLGNVRVHHDDRATELARSIQARAFTIGPHIFFRRGEFQPSTWSCQKLLAHELTHVVQQNAAPGPTTRRVASAPAVIQRMGDPSLAPSMPCAVPTSSPTGSLTDILFAKDSATISSTARATLESIVASWHANPSRPNIRVDGFASTDGAQAHNWTLSCNRAMAVNAVLTGPTSAGAPGIPSTSVSIFAQGATAEFGAAPGGNRRATVDMAASTPTPPAPTPPAAGALCGPNVTDEVRAAVGRTRTTFGGWGRGDREAHCDALDSYRTGAYAWDIVELHNNAWISARYRPACATAGATPPCGSTVQIDSDCSYAGSPNYVIFGAMCRLCSDHYAGVGDASGAARFTQPAMQKWIRFYKGPGVFSGGSGNFVPSTQWADAGYVGWPSVPSPAGDRNSCNPSCPSPFAGPAFHVAWWRNDGLFTSPSLTLI